MRRITLFMLLVCVSLPANAVENEIRIGVTTATRYNDNVFNASRGKRDSFAFVLGPVVRLRTKASKFEAEADYSPRYVTYAEGWRNDDLNHALHASLDYRPSERLTFGLREALALRADLDRDFFRSGGAGDLDNGGDKQTLSSDLDADFTYRVTPRVSLSSSAGYLLISREDKDLSDSNQISGQLQGGYASSPKATFGGGVSARRQVVKGIEAFRLEGTSTDYYGFYLFWNYRLTPLLRLEASGGPTWLFSNLDNDGKGSQKSLDYFASAGLRAEFDGGSAAIDYQRSNSDYARNSTVFLVDSVNVSMHWALNRKWNFNLSAGWNQRKAITNSGSAPGFVNRVTQWQSSATASYRLARELACHFTVAYLRQEQSSFAASDQLRAAVRFDYNARPFRF